jgi:hypothetical protein
MADDDNDAWAYEQRAEPAPDLESLGRLVGTWAMSGDMRGTVTYEWMEGSFFLIQRVDLGQQGGKRIKGLEVIGHERLFGAEPSEEIKSRFYSNTGDTIDYVYELEGDTLTIWAGERGLQRFTGACLATTATPLPVPGTTRGAAVTRRPPPGSADRHTRQRSAGLRRCRNRGFRRLWAGQHRRSTWTANSISILGPSPGPSSAPTCT